MRLLRATCLGMATGLLACSLYASPAQAEAERTCYSITDTARYCPAATALKLEHAAPGAPAISGPMPHMRAFFSNETKPFSATIVLAIPVTLQDGRAVSPANLYAVVKQNSDADAWQPGSFENEWLTPSDGIGEVAVVGEFTGRSAGAGLHTNYVFDAWLDGKTVFALMTIDDRDTITDALRNQHKLTREAFQMRP